MVSAIASPSDKSGRTSASELVRYGLQISVNKPVIDWTAALRAPFTVSSTPAILSESDGKNDSLIIPAGVHTINLSIDVSASNKPLHNQFSIVAAPQSRATLVIDVQDLHNTPVASSMAASGRDTRDTCAYRQHITVDAKADSHLDIVCVNAASNVGFFDLIVTAGKNASISILSLDAASGCGDSSNVDCASYIARSIKVALPGEGASCTQKVLSLCGGAGLDSHESQRPQYRQQHDLYTESIHLAPRTQSDILTRSVVLSGAKSVSRSLIRIGEDAFGSEGYEKQEALVLSAEAEADAIPNLEIHNHDVKCSHGSTIGRLDEEKLFYLMSRGLSRADAIKTMVQGYFSPVLRSLHSEEIKQRLLSTIEHALDKVA